MRENRFMRLNPHLHAVVPRGEASRWPKARLRALRRRGLLRNEEDDTDQRTLQDWEQGRRAPSGPARTLLMVAENPRALLDAASVITPY